MEIVVLPMVEAREFRSELPWAAISITNFGDTFPQLSSDNRVGLLRLDFDDTNNRKGGSFTPFQAREIIQFAQEVVPKIDTLMIHCHAGMSRSPAVAAALYKLLTNEDDSYYFSSYTPNTLVYGTILKIAVRHLGIVPGELIQEND